MGFVGKINIGGSTAHSVGSTLYGTCSTPADTQTKIVSLPALTNFMTGVTIRVRFTYGNTVSAPKLNVNGLGAKNIYRHGTTAIGSRADNAWAADAIVAFTYDGTYWRVDEPFDVTQIWRQIYPVGSIYMSVNNTNPGTLFGGTWVQLKDRFLLGAGDTYTNGATGGEATHTLTIAQLPSHNHSMTHTHDLGSHTHTIGSHTHTLSHTHNISEHNHSIPQHTHTIADHTHTVKAHSHTVNSHNHSAPTHTHGIASHAHNIPGFSVETSSSGQHWHSISDANRPGNDLYYEDEQDTSKPLGSKHTTWWKASTRSYQLANTTTDGAHTHVVTIPQNTTSGTALTTNANSAANTGNASPGTSELAAFNTGSTSLTVNNSPSGTVTGNKALTTGAASTSTTSASGNGNTGSVSLSTNLTGNTTNTGTGQAHNNMPPYLVVYMWRRTA